MCKKDVIKILVGSLNQAGMKVADYLKKQGRFAHLKDKDIEEICSIRDAKWAQMRKHWNCK